jgi:hypothetical protein
MKSEMVVLVRIALYIISGRLAAGGWLPQDIAAQLGDPAVAEAITGVVLGGFTLIWYKLSAARKALQGEA